MFYSFRFLMTGEREAETVSKHHVNALVRPPNLFLSGLTAGCVLELIAPLGPGLAGGSARPVWVGLGLVVIAVGIAAKAVSQFTQAGTSIPVDQPTDALVTNGLYGLSRNPIYIALVILYLGLSIALTSGWALLVLPFLIVILQRGVIEREEVFLAKEFGETYLSYKKKVPRWL